MLRSIGEEEVKVTKTDVFKTKENILMNTQSENKKSENKVQAIKSKEDEGKEEKKKKADKSTSQNDRQLSLTTALNQN